MRQISAIEQRSIARNLILRPFPVSAGLTTRSDTLERYREDLVSQAGVAIFIMGTKAENGRIVPLPGMRAEYELARKQRSLVVPVGASGGMAARLWTEARNRIPGIFGPFEATIAPLLDELNGPVRSLRAAPATSAGRRSPNCSVRCG